MLAFRAHGQTPTIPQLSHLLLRHLGRPSECSVPRVFSVKQLMIPAWPRAHRGPVTSLSGAMPSATTHSYVSLGMPAAIYTSALLEIRKPSLTYASSSQGYSSSSYRDSK